MRSLVLSHRLLPIALTLAFLAAPPAVTSRAAEPCCARCGCAAPCQKVCRLVCEEKKVEVTCWGCKCEDFCVPGPSTPGCRHGEPVCLPSEAADKASAPCVQAKCFFWTEWFPSSAKVHTRKKLLKKVETRTIPSYKWVVEDLCPACAAQAPAEPPRP